MSGRHRTAIGSALRAAQGGKRPRPAQAGSKAKTRPDRGTIVVPLPPDDPAMIRLGELQEQRRLIGYQVADLLDRPADKRPAGRIEDLAARLQEIDQAIEAIPTTVELPLDWWTLPANHPHRKLAAEQAAEPEQVAAKKADDSKNAEVAHVQASLEDLASVKARFPTGADALRAMFAECATMEERVALYMFWRKCNGRRTLPRSITGPRPVHPAKFKKMIEVPRKGGGTRPWNEGWLLCGAPTRSGAPCRRLVLRTPGAATPLTCDGYCPAHTIDPRCDGIKERWRAGMRRHSANEETRRRMSEAACERWRRAREKESARPRMSEVTSAARIEARRWERRLARLERAQSSISV
jgi:hypothetical protein